MQALPKSRLLRFVEQAFHLARRAVARYSSKFSKRRYTLRQHIVLLCLKVRKNTTYRTLQRYGAWQQYSVFEVETSKTQRVELEAELESQIEPADGDRIRIYRLCDACLKATTDIGAPPPDEQSNVL